MNVTTEAEPIAAHFERAGFDRRTVLRWSAAMAAGLALPTVPFAAQIAEAVTTKPRLPVLWLDAQDCMGDVEAALRTAKPSPSDLILNRISLDYSELVMAGSGSAAESALNRIMVQYPGQYVVVVAGSVPMGANGIYCCVGGHTFLDLLRRVVSKAYGVIATGTCAVGGGISQAAGGVTGAVGVRQALGGMSAKYLALPGCPVNGDNLTAALVSYLALGQWPATDSLGRPMFAYGSRIHSRCERRKFYEAEQFARSFGDPGHQAGWCLKELGCQGPETRGNCPTQKFNSGTSWPVASGAPCIGCTTSGFWDRLSETFNHPETDD